MKNSKKTSNGNTTRDTIVAAARLLFAADGYENTSTERILEDSHVSRGALYYHFNNKEALFGAVLEMVEEELAEIAFQAAAQAADPIEGLRTAFAAFLQKTCKPEIRQIVLVDAHSVVGWKKWREIEDRHGLGLLKQGLKMIAATGRISDELVDVYAHILLAALIEVAFMASAAPDSAAEIEKGRQTMAHLLDLFLSKQASDRLG